MTQTMTYTIETARGTVTRTLTVMRGKIERTKASIRANAPAGSTVTFEIN